MNCRFDKNRNALGVYRVLTDSILSSIVQKNNPLDVENTMSALKGYLNAFTYENNEVETFKKHVLDTVETAYKDVLNKFVNLDVIKPEQIENINAQFLRNNVESVLSTLYTATSSKNPTKQPQESSDTSNSKISTSTPGTLTKGGVTSGTTLRTTANDLFKGGSMNTPQNVSVNPNSVKFVTDVGSNYFSGAETAFKSLSRNLTNKLYEIRILNPLSSNASNANEQLNKDIKAYKNQLFSDLISGLELAPGSPSVLYDKDGNLLRNDLKTIIKTVEGYFDTFNDGKPITAGNLIVETMKGRFNAKVLNQYNAMVTLKHFDELISHFSAGGISVGELYRGVEVSKNKYKLASTNKMRTNFTDAALNSALDETTRLYKMFVETIPLVKLNGQISNDQYLNFQQIAFTLNKLKLDISNTAPVEKLTNAIVDAISEIDSRGGRNLTNGDIKTLLSLYTRIFRTAASDSIIKSRSKTAKKILKAVDESTHIHPELHKENSIANKFNKFHPSGNNINFLQMLVHNMTKIDTNTYGEIIYSYENNSFKQSTMQSKISDQQRSVFRSAVGTTALFKQTSSNENYIRDNYGIEVENGIVTFNFESGNSITYNVGTGVLLNKQGRKIENFNQFPNTSLDDNHNYSGVIIPNVEIESSEILQRINQDNEIDIPQEYSDYRDIVNVFESLLHQPVSSDNYRFLDVMRDEIDGRDSPGKHIQVMLSLMGNFAFLADVNKRSVNGDIAKSPSEKRLALAKALTGIPISPSQIWDNRLGRYIIDFNRSKFGAGNDFLSDYTDALNSYYRTDIKAVTMNTEGNFVPTYSISSAINRYTDIINNVKSSPYSNTSPLVNNFILKATSSDRPLINAFEVRSGVKGQNGEVISASRLNTLELLKSSILYEFLEHRLNDGSFKVQPTNFADKNKHTLINVDVGATVSYYNAATRSWAEKTYKDLSLNQTIDTYYATMGDYYTQLSKELVKDYSKLFDGRKVLLEEYYETTNLAKYLREQGLDVSLSQSPLALAQSLPNFEEVIGSNLQREIDTATELYNLSVPNNVNPFSYNQLANELQKVDSAFQLVSGDTIAKAFRKAGVKWIENLHFERKGRGQPFGINRSLIYSLETYNSNKEQNVKNNERYFLETLIKENFTIDYLNNELKEHNLLVSDKAVKRYNLNKFRDGDLGRYKLFIGDLDGDFEINPILKDYYWNYNLIARNFQNLTVGSPLGHPAKLGPDASNVELMAARLTAQNKRMVIHQATKHPYLMNMINGIGFKSNKVFIADPVAKVFGLLGNAGTTDSVDGSTLSTPTNTNLLNNSLNDQKVGLTHKSIAGGIDERTGAASLTKHALFTITNENIRNSPYLRDLVSKLMSGRLNSLNGVDLKLDITRDYNNQHIDIKALFGQLAFIKSDNHTHLNSSFENGKLLFIDDLINREGTYVAIYSDRQGEQVEVPVQISTHYDLWNILGGDSSVVFNEDSGKYIPSNSSWDMHTEYVNRVGFWNNGNDIKNHLVDSKDLSLFKSIVQSYIHVPNPSKHNASPTNSPLTQKNVIQPLKLNHVGEMTFFSGQKVGMSNGVTLDEILNHDGDPLELTTQVSNLGNGIQLNADHEADQSIVTEQTQVLNTLSFTGNTPEYANKAFGGIAKYISEKLGDLISDITIYDSEAKARANQFIKKLVVNTFETGEVDGLANSITQRLKQGLIDGSIANMQIPVSSPDLYSHVNTAIANYFTKQGIRRKMPGIAAVAKPYSPFIRFRKLPNGQTVSESQFQAWRQENSNEPDIIPILNHEFEIGDTLIYTSLDGNQERIHIEDASTYIRTKLRMNKLDQLGGKWEKDRFAERDLGSTYHRLNITGVGSITYFDIPIFAITPLLQDVKAAFNGYKKAKSDLNSGQIQLSRREVAEGGTLEQRIANALSKLQTRISEYNDVVDLLSMQHPELSEISPLSLNAEGEIEGNISYTKNTENKIKNIAAKVLNNATNNKIIPVPFTINRPSLPVEVNTQNMTIGIDSIDTVLGEIAMGFPHKSSFDIDDGLDVSDVSVQYFEDKLNSRSLPATNQYDLFLKQSNGDHLYVLVEGSENHSNLINAQETILEPITIETVEKDGKLYEIDSYGDIKYETGTDTVYRGLVDGKLLDYVIVSNEDDIERLKPMFNGKGSKYDVLVPNYMVIGEDLKHLELFLELGSRGLIENQSHELTVLQQLLHKNNPEEFADFRMVVAKSTYNTPEKIQNQLDNAEIVLNTSKNNAQRQKASKKIELLTEYLSNPEVFEENLLEVQAINLNSYIDRLMLDIDSKNTSAEKYVEDALKALEVKNVESIIAYNARKAEAKYASFREALKVTTARIPGQDFQSYSAMEVVHFFNDEVNTIMVPPKFQWTTGGDFDIDKVFSTFYSLGRDGLISGWTSLWNNSNADYLRESLRLPLPQATDYDTVELDDNSGLTSEEIMAVYDFVKAGNKYRNINHFSKLVDATHKIANNRLSVQGPVLSEEHSDSLIQYATWYMNDSDADLKDPKGAALNTIFTGIKDSISDIRNIINAYEPVTFGEYSEIANKSKKGEEMKRMSFENPVDIFRAQVANMVGKDVIGIAASSGLKAYSAINTAFLKVKQLGAQSGVPLMRNYEIPVLIDGKFELIKGRGIYGVDFTEDSFENLSKYLKSVFNLNAMEIETIRLGLLERGTVSLDLSSILSAATDNAKELILSRINAGPDTAGYYLAAAMLGVDVKTISTLMTSELVEDILQINNRDVFNGFKPSFESSLSQISNGALDARPYFNFKFATNTIVSIENSDPEDQKAIMTELVREHMLSIKKDNEELDMVTVDVEGIYTEVIRKSPFYYLPLLSKVIAKNPEFKNKVLDALKDTHIVELSSKEGFSTVAVRNKKVNTDLDMYGESGFDYSGGQYDDGNQYDDFNIYEQFNDGFDFAQFEGDMFTDLDMGFGEKGNRLSPLNILMSRYLDDSSKYIKPSHSTADSKNILSALSSLGAFKKDIEVLAKLMSVNQKVKNNHYDLRNFVVALKTYVENNYTPFSPDRSNPNYGSHVATEQDIEMYIQSVFDGSYVSDDRFSAKKSGNGGVIDILSVIGLNPHLRAMLQTAYTTYDLNRKISVKTRAIDKILDRVQEYNWISPEVYGKVTRFVEDAIITTTLDSLPRQNTLFRAFAGEIIEPGKPTLTNELSMDLTTSYGREKFINWFENTVLENLRRGILKDENGVVTTTSDSITASNEFIKRLTLDMRIDPASGQNYTYFHIPVNLLSEDNSDLATMLAMSLSSLRKTYYAGVPITDLFYLYNLIVHKGAIKSHTFTTLLDAVSDLNGDNLITDILGLVSNMDYSENFVLDDIYNNNLYALAARGVGKMLYAPPIVGSDTTYNPKMITVRNWDNDSKLTYFDHYVLEVNESGDWYYKKVDPQMNNKYVNIDVRDTNSNRIGDVRKLARMSRLDKLIANAVKRNINC